MTNSLQKFALLAFSSFIFSSCSTPQKTQTLEAAKPSAPAAAAAIAVHVKCINQEFSSASNLTKHETKFVIIPYKKLKTPGKAHHDKDLDETDDLYFERVSKMAEKVLVEAGLTKAKSSDKEALVVAVSWNTKKRILGSRESESFAKNGNGSFDVEKIRQGEVYLSDLFMKGVAPDRKTTRWEVQAESANADTFYLNVLPPLFIASAGSLGKTATNLLKRQLLVTRPKLNLFAVRIRS